MDLLLREFWNLPAAQVLQELETTAQGLSKNEARRRLIQFGPNLLKPKRKRTL